MSYEGGKILEGIGRRSDREQIQRREHRMGTY